MNKKLKHPGLYVVIFLFFFSATSLAQTIYKSESGLFTPVVKSLYLQGGSIGENTALIGPAVGYRFNKQYDLSLHTEFLSTEFNANNKLSILNAGLILGRTKTCCVRNYQYTIHLI